VQLLDIGFADFFCSKKNQKTYKEGATMQQVMNGKLYDTETATLLASDRYFDGSNWERNGRNAYLYKTPHGRYFMLYTTCWQGERDYMEIVSKTHAKVLYEDDLPEHEVPWSVAFDEIPEEA
jgi:hypothetical protein